MSPIIFPAPDDIETADVLLGENATFFAVNRNLTNAYIAENPTQIVLVPTVYITTTSGGRQKTSGTPRASQTVRLIELDTIVGLGGLRASEGVEHESRWVILMEHDAVVVLGDTFTYDGAEWEVVDFQGRNGYEIRAVARRG